MKREFGTRWTRLLWGGTTLWPAEHALLEALVNPLPVNLRSIVEAQFEAYNLVQRESDGRTLNFYLKVSGKPTTEGLPLLSHKGEEVPLVRVTATLGNPPRQLHAVLTAVAGRVFCVSMDRAITADERTMPVAIHHTVNAWRSNFAASASEV